MVFGRALLLPVLGVMLASFGPAQDGVSSASAARARYMGNLGVIPSSREIAVEEFVNYHRHELGRPKAGATVALDLRWARASVSQGGEAILQIGLSTALANDRQQLRPINLSLVIDKSGSMAAGDKMSRVKAALLTLVSQLREHDTLSIVVFDNEAEVLLPSQSLRSKDDVQSLIRTIQPGSSTNIHAGLMLGYKEALKNYKKDWTNRVILLTDGIANRGVTEPAKIAQESLGYNDRGIDLSTIGVGLDLNKDLLRELAKSGRGLFHFVADTEDIEKVFVRELQSLVSPVARDPKLVLEFGPSLRLEHVYGYEPTGVRKTLTFELDDMNSGMTQVVLMRLSPTLGASRCTVRARLSYHDIALKKNVTMLEDAHVDVLYRGEEEGRVDPSVLKNLTIADLAQAIKDMAASCEQKRFHEAERLLGKATSTTQERFPNLQDPDIKRTYDIAKKYEEALHKENHARGVEEDDRPSPKVKGDNLILNGDFRLGNTGFDSDLRYIAPSPNCLWGPYYTVTSSFSSPYQLHTNVPAQPYDAPKGGQVLFMNSGGTKQFTVWSADVKCKPRTKYLIRFREIGLSGGPEWTNSYEIRVSGARSEPQLGGVFKFAVIEYEWTSGSSTSAKVSIVRLPHPRMGGVIGIANIEMLEMR